ncbi:A24 family peptidase [Patescibacteria group bacterium]|nr:A24 family peptidase [Patescibacteria group bacterium]
MLHLIFLFSLAIIWIFFATIQDLRTKEIANWLNFSLIIFALGFRFFFSLFSDNFSLFYQGLIGLAIFFVIGNLFYYGKFFAGGDAKLMIALGAILPISDNLLQNLRFFGFFVISFFIIGAMYTLISSILLSFMNFNNFKKEFLHLLKKNKKIVYFSFLFSFFLILLGFFEKSLFILFLIPLFLCQLYIYIKAVDESCLVKTVSTNKLTEGDWLYRDVKLKRGLIKANWGGLRKEDIIKIKKEKKRVKIREGIAFSPVFLIAFIIFIFIIFLGLFENFWSFLRNSLW